MANRILHAQAVGNAKLLAKTMQPVNQGRHGIANVVQHLGRRIGLAGLEGLVEERKPRVVDFARQVIELSRQCPDFVIAIAAQLARQVTALANAPDVRCQLPDRPRNRAIQDEPDERRREDTGETQESKRNRRGALAETEDLPR